MMLPKFFGLVTVNMNDPFEFSVVTQTIEATAISCIQETKQPDIRTTFFCEGVINVWNKLPDEKDFPH